MMASRSAPVSVEQILQMVEKRNMTTCVCQLICELTCNPDIYDTEGRHVYETFKKLENTTEVSPLIEQFRVAKMMGDKYQPGRTCGLCDGDYPQCKTPHKVMLNLANQLTIK